MSFFDSRSTRIPLAVIGGFLYGLLTYQLLLFIGVSSVPASSAGFFVFLLYLGSRFLLLFSGLSTPYYSRGKKDGPAQKVEGNPFYQASQWVGKFYHYHDLALFVFLILIAGFFLITLIVDLSGHQRIGNTIQSFWNSLSFLSE